MNRPRFAMVACSASFIVPGISGTLLGPTFQSLTKQFNMPLENAGIFTALQFIGVTITVIQRRQPERSARDNAAMPV